MLGNILLQGACLSGSIFSWAGILSFSKTRGKCCWLHLWPSLAHHAEPSGSSGFCVLLAALTPKGFRSFLELGLNFFSMTLSTLWDLAKLVCFELERPRNKQPFRNGNQIICLSHRAVDQLLTETAISQPEHPNPTAWRAGSARPLQLNRAMTRNVILWVCF